MEFLHLSGTLRGAGQGLLGGRQRLVQCDDQRVITQHHSHRLGRITGPPLLEHADRLGNLLRHRWVELFHRAIPSFP